jgi:D-beta-D-heptose 7-phosphate kinase/D-beta-D-heptose 1-phosphate adenosyltransferase
VNGTGRQTSSKIVDRAEAVAWRRRLAREGRKVVFTNGCFDLVHRGHVDLLRQARALGDALIVGVNDDASVRRLKGAARPLTPEDDRAEVLAALEMVDRVVLFHEDDPGSLIAAVVPDVLVKGDDWAHDAIVGRETVEAAGGRVERVHLTPGRSTRGLIRTVLERCGAGGAKREEGE